MFFERCLRLGGVVVAVVLSGACAANGIHQVMRDEGLAPLKTAQEIGPGVEIGGVNVIYKSDPVDASRICRAANFLESEEVAKELNERLLEAASSSSTVGAKFEAEFKEVVTAKAKSGYDVSVTNSRLARATKDELFHEIPEPAPDEEGDRVAAELASDEGAERAGAEHASDEDTERAKAKQKCLKLIAEELRRGCRVSVVQGVFVADVIAEGGSGTEVEVSEIVEGVGGSMFVGVKTTKSGKRLAWGIEYLNDLGPFVKNRPEIIAAMEEGKGKTCFKDKN